MQILEFIIDDTILKYLYSDNKMFTLIFILSIFSCYYKKKCRQVHLKMIRDIVISCKSL